MADYTGKYYAEGNGFLELNSQSLSSLDEGISYYELLRVMEGTCLFLPDHLHRMQDSLRLAGLSYRIDKTIISSMLAGLIRINGIQTGNIRLVLQPSVARTLKWYAYYVPHYYPTEKEYEEGVPVDIFSIMRRDPNIKQYRSDYHWQMREFISRQNVFEALLSDDNNCITEGSKTNVFFIRDGKVYTAPGKNVLKGITRQKIIELCNSLNYELIESSISTDTLPEMDAVFLSGTSPKILPVNKIGNLGFKVADPVMRSLMKAYDGLIRDYISMEKDYRA